jgi:hypothetical protein
MPNPRPLAAPLFLAAIFLVSLGLSCASATYRPDPAAFPPLNAEITAAIEAAEPCARPAVATPTLGRDFRYGCFCGRDYPRIAIASGGWAKDYRSISARERRARVLDLYRVRPIDTVDLACRNHDICMLDSGSRSERCDRDFGDHLAAIHRFLFSEQMRHDDLDSWQYRCDLLVEVLQTGLDAWREPSGVVGDLRLDDPDVKARLEPILQEPGSEFPRRGERCQLRVSDYQFGEELGLQQRSPWDEDEEED